MTRQAATAGPLLHATLIVADAKPLVQAYAALGLVVRAAGTVSAAQAAAWGHTLLAGCTVTELAPGLNAPTLLRLIDVPGTPQRPTRFSHGWLALEILVRDVDALALQLPGQGFEIVGPPADLDLSPAIRAMQVVGPSGEMLYLTQVKAPVPPFEIPLSSELPGSQALGPLFIAVMSAPAREAAIAACAPLQPGPVLRFETKVTVLNRALGQAMDTRWPVATVQWAGRCLFEIDEVLHPQVVRAAPAGALPAGLAWVGMRVASVAVDQGLIELSPGAWLELLAPT